MLDRSGSGALRFPDFKELWNILNGWKAMFVQNDRDRSGSIDAPELAAIILSVGLVVSEKTLSVIVSRHWDISTKRIYFDGFVAAIVKVRALSDAFKSMDPQQKGSVQMSYDQFINLAIGI